MMRRFMQITDIEWCPVHHGYLNEDSHRCDASWWSGVTEPDHQCRPIAVYVKRKEALSNVKIPTNKEKCNDHP